MKLLAIEMTRVTALFHATRKSGQLFLPDASYALADRYSFANFPQSAEEVTSDRFDFLHGKFEEIAIDSFSIFGDGIVIASRSDTDLVDEFLADLLNWIDEEMDVSIVPTHLVDRIYDSNLIVETEIDWLAPLEAYSKISDTISQNLKDTIGLEVQFEPFGVSLADDQTKNTALKPSTFRLERRAGIAFSMHQFVSSAPLRTQQHFAIARTA